MNKEISEYKTHQYSLSLHDWPVPHADLFLLENSSFDNSSCNKDDMVLETWRLNQFPFHLNAVKQLSGTAEPLTTHRYLYLNYSGQVSDNRGTVSLWDQGQAGVLRKPQIIYLKLQGIRYNGMLTLKYDGPSGWIYHFE